MQRNKIFEYCSVPDNTGLSLWCFPKGKRRTVFLTSSLQTIPCFDSNLSYVILKFNQQTYLNMDPYPSFMLYYWIGSRCEDYYKNIQDVVQIASDLKSINKAKCRVQMEFQYGESFNFMSLFKHADLMESVKETSAIWYLDYKKGGAASKQQVGAFQKFCIIEMVDYTYEYPKYFFRIYEKKQIRNFLPTLIYFSINGELAVQQVEEEGKKQEVNIEKLIKIDVLIGSKVNFYLQKFAKTLLANYIKQNSACQIEEFKMVGEAVTGIWKGFEEKAQYMNQDADFIWAMEQTDQQFADTTQNYLYPLEITNWDWQVKTEKQQEQAFDDAENVKYTITDDYNLNLKKREMDFDPNLVEIFRVSLALNEQNIIPKVKNIVLLQKDKEDFSVKYLISFQQLKLLKLDCSMLNSMQIYLLYSPSMIHLWFGQDVSLEKQKGSLNILKSFVTTKLFEHLSTKPSFEDQSQNISVLRYRIEYQDYESQRMQSYFRKGWPFDKLRFVNMGAPRAGMGEEEKDDGQIDDFDGMLQFNRQSSQTEFIRKSQVVAGDQIQSVQMKTDRRTVKQNKQSLSTHQLHQQNFISLVQANFNPISILSKPSVEESKRIKETKEQQFNFDQMDMYAIEGYNFDHISDPMMQGIFDQTKSYFVIFTKYTPESLKHKTKHAIYMWRGAMHQTTIGKQITQLQETSMAFDKFAINQERGNNPFANNLSMMAGSAEESKTNEYETLIPTHVSKLNLKDEELEKAKAQNMKAVGAKDGKNLVNMKGMIIQDQEPQHFLQAFQGAMVILTNDYLKFSNQQFQGDEKNYIMLFQLIGVPSLNQKAREVPPIYKSLSTSGVYILFNKNRTCYWIGAEYLNSYLTAQTYNKQESLISEALLDKAYYAYETAMDQVIEERIVWFELEGKESKDFLEILLGNQQTTDYSTGEQIELDEGSFQRDLLSYESKFVKTLSAASEPRLYCLVFNSSIIEYENQESSAAMGSSEGATDYMLSHENSELALKEINNFTQKSLDQRGIFLLDFQSEAFVWLGKKVQDKERLIALQLGFYFLKLLRKVDDKLDKMAITLVNSGSEPEIFKNVFNEWQNYEHIPSSEASKGGATTAADLDSSDDDGDKGQGLSKQKTLSKEINVTHIILPEDYWYHQ